MNNTIKTTHPSAAAELAASSLLGDLSSPSMNRSSNLTALGDQPRLKEASEVSNLTRPSSEQSRFSRFYRIDLIEKTIIRQCKKLLKLQIEAEFSGQLPDIEELIRKFSTGIEAEEE